MKTQVIIEDGIIKAYRKFFDDGGAQSGVVCDFQVEYGTQDEPKEDPRWQDTDKEIVSEGVNFYFADELEAQKLLVSQQAKLKENDEKANEARFNRYFTVKIGNVNAKFQTTKQTQADLQSALLFMNAGQKSYPWTDEDGQTFNFTSVDQIVAVSTEFMNQSNVYDKWGEYKAQIEAAKTAADCDAINIVY